jgi:hypothetical protein
MRETAAHPSKGLRTDQPYEAIVVDENDPDKLGQIRARVPGLMDGIPDDQLPWARPRDWNHPFGQMAKKKTGIGKKELLQQKEVPSLQFKLFMCRLMT